MDTFKVQRHRIAFLGVGLGFVVLVLTASTALAAPTTLTASFNEVTTFRSCPPGLPAGARCYTGVGHGLTIPPGDPNSVENFAGYVVFNNATGCGPDYNVVSISTTAGTLYLTTQGVACATGPATDIETGTWTARGGTGIFRDASGSGPVTTAGTFNANGTVSSQTTYSSVPTAH